MLLLKDAVLRSLVPQISVMDPFNDSEIIFSTTTHERFHKYAATLAALAPLFFGGGCSSTWAERIGSGAGQRSTKWAVKSLNKLSCTTSGIGRFPENTEMILQKPNVCISRYIISNNVLQTFSRCKSRLLYNINFH